MTSKKNKPNPDSTQPGENSRFLAFALVTYDMPPIDPSDAIQVEDRIRWYFQHCMDEDMKPGIVGLANSLGVDRLTLRYWADGKYRRATHTPLIRKAYEFIEENMELYMMNGKINPAAGIFLMKNNYGYKDQTDIQLAPPEQNAETPAEQLQRKYMGAVVDVEVSEPKALDWASIKLPPVPEPEEFNVRNGRTVPEYMQRTDNVDPLPKRNADVYVTESLSGNWGVDVDGADNRKDIPLTERPKKKRKHKPMRAKSRRKADIASVLGETIGDDAVERLATAQGLKSRNAKSSKARRERLEREHASSESANNLNMPAKRGGRAKKPVPEKRIELNAKKGQGD